MLTIGNLFVLVALSLSSPADLPDWLKETPPPSQEKSLMTFKEGLVQIRVNEEVYNCKSHPPPPPPNPAPPPQEPPSSSSSYCPDSASFLRTMEERRAHTLKACYELPSSVTPLQHFHFDVLGVNWCPIAHSGTEQVNHYFCNFYYGKKICPRLLEWARPGEILNLRKVITVRLYLLLLLL